VKRSSSRSSADDNHNASQDPGETFVYTNVGIPIRTAFPSGETFVYYNVGDTNQNGVQDPGETFQFTVSHAATPVDTDFDGFNDGDTNHNGALISARLAIHGRLYGQAGRHR